MRIYVKGELLPNNTPVLVMFESDGEREHLAIDLLTNGSHATIIAHDNPEHESVQKFAIEGVKALFAEQGKPLPENLLMTNSNGETNYDGEFPQ